MTSSNPPTTPERVLERLDWKVIRRLDGHLQGDYRTLFTGAGLDFTEVRAYEPRDDVRHIDWNVTARMNELFVRKYVEDRELTAWLLCDRSPSMDFGTPERPKELVLTEFVTTLARLLTRNGNRVGAVLWNNELEATIAPKHGRNQVLRLARDLLKPVANTGTTTDLTDLVEFALSTIKRRSLVFLISDFISEPGWGRPLSLLAARHELIPIRLWDSAESEIPDVGIIVLEDAETGEQLQVDTGDPLFRERFAQIAKEREDALAAGVRRAGVTLHDIATDEDLATALIRLCDKRRKLGRARGG